MSRERIPISFQILVLSFRYRWIRKEKCGYIDTRSCETHTRSMYIFINLYQIYMHISSHKCVYVYVAVSFTVWCFFSFLWETVPGLEALRWWLYFRSDRIRPRYLITFWKTGVKEHFPFWQQRKRRMRPDSQDQLSSEMFRWRPLFSYG